MAATHVFDYARRCRAVELILTASRADFILVTKLTDIRWLTGFTGSNAVVLVGNGELLFVTDGRYRTQVTSEVSGCRILIADSGALSVAMKDVRGSVLYQADDLSVADFEGLSDSHPSVRLQGRVSLLSELRSAKDSSEIKCIKQALGITESTVAACIKKVYEGVSERDFAAEIDHEHARRGSERPSFETIVAFGERSALPHATPTGRKLRNGDLILIDCGCTIDGYASDMTRCFFFGDADPLVERIYDIVNNAVAAAVAAARPGMTSSDLDAVARNVIDQEGYEEYFVHSLGHGVGIDVHEPPRIAKNASGILPDNGIVTIEPGIYLPGKFGIRIEEMVLLTNGSAERLNHSSTAFTQLPV